MTRKIVQKKLSDLMVEYKEAEKNLQAWTTRSVELRGAIVELQKLLTNPKEIKDQNAKTA